MYSYPCYIYLNRYQFQTRCKGRFLIFFPQNTHMHPYFCQWMVMLSILPAVKPIPLEPFLYFLFFLYLTFKTGINLVPHSKYNPNPTLLMGSTFTSCSKPLLSMTVLVAAVFLYCEFIYDTSKHCVRHNIAQSCHTPLH